MCNIFFGFFLCITFATGLENNYKTGKHSRALMRKRIQNQCPSESLINKENDILSPKSHSKFLNKAVYGCRQTFVSKEFKFINSILSVYSCNFTNSNSDQNAIYFNSNSISSQLEGDIVIEGCRFNKYYSKIGGSIYIFSSDPLKTVSIANCYFNFDSTIPSEKGGAIYINSPLVIIKNTQFINCNSENGGCLYYTNENNNQGTSTKFSLKVKRCIFKNNRANSNGGCLYLTTPNNNIASSIEVKGCKFTDNSAENGCDLSFFFNHKRSITGEKLTITENTFTKNSKLSIKENSKESLIYATFNPNSNIEFTNNRVSIDKSFANKVFLFDYPEGTSISKKQLQIAGNIMQPFFANQIDIKNVINSQFGFDTARLLEEEMPTDEDCKPKPETFTDEDFYGCKQILRESITVDNHLLHIYHCSFANFDNSVPITIKNYKGDGSILIKGTKFFYCNKKSILLSSVEATEITISECTFSFCTIKDQYIIDFASRYGTIEQCYFCDNSKSYYKNGIEIFYEPPSPQENDRLTIKQCFYEHANPSSTFVSFTLNSKLNFIDNNIAIYDTSTVFKLPTGFTDFTGFTITGNTMIPYKKELFGCDLPDSAIIELPDSECSKLPEGIENTGQNTELCGNIGETSQDTFVTSNSIVSIFYSLFQSYGNSQSDGGAIYIKIPNVITTDVSNSLKIYYSAFTSCTAKNGCAIYFESLEENSRLFDIHRCIFSQNNMNSECNGGCIYIDTALSCIQLTECIFNNNVAKNGGCIYYTSYSDSTRHNLLDTNNDENQFALYIKDCQFASNSGKDNGGVVYISVSSNKPHRLIEFNNCQIIKNDCIDFEGGSPDTDREDNGGAIYYAFSSLSATPSNEEKKYNFRVIECLFHENIVTNHGGALYISMSGSELANSVEITNSLFSENHASTSYSDVSKNSGYGGDIYFYLDQTTKSQTPNTDPSLYIHDCYFLNSEAFSEGGSICILIKDSESLRPIEINQCSFNYNNNYDTILSLVNKNGVFIAYTIISSTESEHNDNPPLHVNDCNLSCSYRNESEDKQTEKGGLIYLSVKNCQQTGCIEINRCKLSSNINDTESNLIGGSIYYSYESSSSNSKSLLDANSILKLSDCEFSDSYSKLYGGSLYFTVTGGENKQIEINHCSFEKTKSEENNDSIYIKSDSKSVHYSFTDCDFLDAPIFFEALSATIDSCRFNEYDTGKNAIRYLSHYAESTTDSSFTINNCNFTQKEKDLSLVYFETELSSKFTFTNNVINFSNLNSHVFDRNSNIAVKINEYWSFDNNAIEPAEYSVIKTEIADDIPAYCGKEFLCPVLSSLEEEEPSSSEELSSSIEEIPEESSSQEEPPVPEEPIDENCTLKPDSFTKDDFYACKLRIKGQVSSKGQILIEQCNFTNFKSTAVNITEYTGGSEGSIIINRCNFVSCQKGALNINNAEPKELKISRCYFIFCATTDEASVIKFTSKRGIIEKCKFYYNTVQKMSTGVIDYDNPSTEPDDILTIRGCFFENSGFDSSFFLYFTSGSKFEFTNNVFKIYNSDTRIFVCQSDSVDIHEYAISGNTLHPLESNLIGDGITIPENAFSSPPKSECPGLPDGVEQTENNLQCGNIADDLNDGTLIHSNTIVSIYYSSFSSTGNSECSGGAVYVSLPDNMQIDSIIPVKIYYSVFFDCTAKYGSGIYLETSQQSRLFDINHCTFHSNFNDQCLGSGVYIKSPLSTFKFSRCLFKENVALDGACIYYTTGDTSSTSKNLLEANEGETKFALNIRDCVFQGNSAYNNGGTICINVNNGESPKPIEINSCIFLSNSNQEEDDAKERGGAIYYSYNSQSSTPPDSSSGENNYVFHVFNSVFEENKVNDYGGAIYVSVTSHEPYHPIEIDNCSFETNEAVDGGCIYYSFEPSTTFGKALLETIEEVNNYGFHVTLCSFEGNTATNNGGSICLIMTNGEPSKTTLIDDCTFTSCKSKNGGAIYYKYQATSSSGTSSINDPALCVNKCTFSYNSNNVFSDVENGGSIFISTKNSEFPRLVEINGSSFKNSKAQNGGSIYYSLESSSLTQTNDNINLLKIYDSTFSSGDGLLGCALYLKSFENSRLFDIYQCTFDSNSEMNTKENSLCGGGIYIQSIHSCFKLTKCIFNSNKANDGAAVYYISDESSSLSKSLLDTNGENNNLALYFDDCQFKSNSAIDSGGAIYISIKNLKSPKPIEINNCKFTLNAAVEPEFGSETDYDEFGGAIYYSFDSSLTGATADESSYIFRVVDSNFDRNEVTGYGGSIHISVSHNEPSNIIEIGRCSFVESHSEVNNYNVERTGHGGDICYLLDQVVKSQLSNPSLHIYDCSSLNSHAFDKGGSICILVQSSESLKPIEIERCSFKSDMSINLDYNFQVKNGVFLSYSVDSTSASSSDNNPPLHVNDCNFSCTLDPNDEFIDKFTQKGGSIYLSIKNSQQNGCIEINSCNFTTNFYTSQEFVGGAIYYSHESSPSNSRSLLEAVSVLKVTNCEFSETYSKMNGGSIYMTIDGAENKQVDINHCSFVKSSSQENKDSVYTTSDSKTVTFNIIDCDFMGNSLFFNALSAKIESCRFDDIEKNYNAIKYVSHYGDTPSTECTLSISKCNFTQKTNQVSLVYFETELSSKFSFTDNTIVFPDNSYVLDSKSEITHKGVDYWYFKNNAIDPAESVVIKTEKAFDIPATCGTQFLCPVPSSSEEDSSLISSEEDSSLISSEEESSLISSEEEQQSVDSSSAENQPEESSSEEKPPSDSSLVDESSSESESSSEEPSSSDGNCLLNNPCIMVDGDGTDSVTLEDKDYKELHDTRHGAAIRLVNYGLQCIRSNFTSCTVSEGGGGIYIALYKTTNLPILLQNLTFKHCQAIYGGAVYIYSDQEQNEVKIISCIFEENTASKRSDPNLENHLYGGAAVYMQAKNSNVTSCSFIRNHGSGIKIFRDFTKNPPTMESKILEKGEQPMITITDCFFEIDEEPSSSSIFYAKGTSNETPIEVIDCIFTGKLSEGSYHIDGSNSKTTKSSSENKKPKIHIKSCKFSSPERNAMNLKLLDASFDSNSQIFNSKENEKTPESSNNSNYRYGTIMNIAAIAAVIAAVAVLTITIIKKKYSQEEKADNISDNVIELNAAEL